jgi:hypothetical protein
MFEFMISSGALMQRHRITSTETKFDFDSAIKRASVIAFELLGDNMLVSGYDHERDFESPGHVSECHEGCKIKGFCDYALNRGGALTAEFNDGCFVFCFRPLGDIS